MATTIRASLIRTPTTDIEAARLRRTMRALCAEMASTRGELDATIAAGTCDLPVIRRAARICRALIRGVQADRLWRTRRSRRAMAAQKGHRG